MGRRRFKNAAFRLLILTVPTIFIFEIHLYVTSKTLARDYAALAQRVEVVAGVNGELANEASKWRQRAEDAQRRLPPLPARESSERLAARVRALANEMLDFENERTVGRPPTIVGGFAGGGEDIMRRNFEQITLYERTAVTDCLKRFGGSVNGIVRKSRPYALDTGRLQRHIETICNLLMIRLIANDLNDLAGQLDTAQPKRSRPELQISPDLRSIAAHRNE
jgi:hypothetical protein